MAKFKFKTFFLIGFILLVIAFIIWLIPSIYLVAINGRIESLNSQPRMTELLQTTIVNYQNLKVLWETQQTTIYNPPSTTLSAISIIIFVYGVRQLQTMKKSSSFYRKISEIS